MEPRTFSHIGVEEESCGRSVLDGRRTGVAGIADGEAVDVVDIDGVVGDIVSVDRRPLFSFVHFCHPGVDILYCCGLQAFVLKEFQMVWKGSRDLFLSSCQVP